MIKRLHRIYRRLIQLIQQIGVWKIIKLAINFTIAPVLTKLLTKATYSGQGSWITINNFCNYWHVRQVAPNTTYVFVFLGEFGYELFNWQGVVRKFHQQLPASSNIVIAGRKGLNSLYESASQYLDISDFSPYKESIAAAYFAIPPDMNSRSSPWNPHELAFDISIRKKITICLIQQLNCTTKNIEFIFSSNLTAFPGCIFGVDRTYYGFCGHYGNIYNRFDFLTKNNFYTSITPDLNSKREIEEKLRFSLNRPYILIQNRSRKIGPQYGMLQHETQKIIVSLAQHMPIVLLSFHTGRLFDSESSVESPGANCLVYQSESFREQGTLIYHAHNCVFFTEGDLGSHTYLPPFMGKNVIIIAPQSIFSQPSAPIVNWNTHIFRFGGQMIPFPAELLFNSDSSLQQAVQLIIKGNL